MEVCLTHRARRTLVVQATLLAVALAGCATNRPLASEPHLETPLPTRAAIPCPEGVTGKDDGGVGFAATALRAVLCRRCGNGLYGLPCESGCGTWHARVAGGAGFYLGADSDGSACSYFGADVGRTWPCCVGVDVFYRTFGGRFDRAVLTPGAPAFVGDDVGRFHVVGAKATYERSIRNSRWSWYAGAGPVFFWTQDYLADDDGVGGFGEAGVGYRLGRRWRLRSGLEVHALSTSAARLKAASNNTKRPLWLLAPVLQIEFSF